MSISKGQQFLSQGGRRMRITLTVVAPPGATLLDVKGFLGSLEYAGRWYNPAYPVAESLHIETQSVRYLRRESPQRITPSPYKPVGLPKLLKEARNK